MWNALQMVWGMEAFKMENGGSLVHPEEVVKRAREELAKQKVETSGPAGESMSGKDWTKAHKANLCTQAARCPCLVRSLPGGVYASPRQIRLRSGSP